MAKTKVLTDPKWFVPGNKNVVEVTPQIFKSVFANVDAELADEVRGRFYNDYFDNLYFCVNKGSAYAALWSYGESLVIPVTETAIADLVYDVVDTCGTAGWDTTK